MSDESLSFSLADLAGLDTTEIQAITSRLPEAGIYTVFCEEIGFREGESKDGKPPLHRLAGKLVIRDATLINKNVDVEKLIDKTLPWQFPMWPSNIEETIGLLKGQYRKVGIDTSGVMGGMPAKGDADPIEGWVDQLVGAEFQIRVNVNNERAYYDFLPPANDGGDEAEAA